MQSPSLAPHGGLLMSWYFWLTRTTSNMHFPGAQQPLNPTGPFSTLGGGPHARGAAAKRSYPISEVWGSGPECQAATAQGRLRGATPHLRPGAAAGRSYPSLRSGAASQSARRPRHSKGQEELFRIRGQGRRLGAAAAYPRSGGCRGAGGPRGAIPRSRSGGAAVRRYPSSK